MPNKTVVNISDRQRLAAKKAWETIRAKRAGQDAGNVPLALANITKGLKVRVISDAGQFAGEVARKLNATSFRITRSGTRPMVAKVGNIYAAAA